MSSLVKTFDRQDRDWAAMEAAEQFLAAAGFSVGRMQRGDPRGILFGQFDIAKWRNLDYSDRDELHGKMTGDMRYGPIRIEIFACAPSDAKRAFHVTATAMQHVD